eukprot:gnl/TRDRNA2_/TRDRNA2_174318_c0_seq2.p1 gnl/TRDRNA2_/TRDRNA2_174318_c0~~gnl/TRDRNA2_/TRDRNA2_174318_c0_seq2.p1  ORF type:complete len:451 (+),score=63.52 gnl/TRDRNA2_/TRDRNA2_174318_c0_seq2:87-1439(+)
MIGNSNPSRVAPIFASPDFIHWHRVGDTTFPAGECPSLYPLPPLTKGTHAIQGEPLPTHVHKRGNGAPGCGAPPHDCVQIGTWVDGEPGVVGSWIPTTGVSFQEKMIDVGSYYASKDFWDPVGARRINWGWALVPPSGVQSLPREVTYHPELKQLVFSPIAELKQLRSDGPTLANRDSPLTLAAGEVRSLGSWPDSAGNTSELLATFALPSSPVRLGAYVMTGASASSTVYIDFKPSDSPGVYNVTAGVETQYLPEMPGFDMPGGDFSVTDVNYTDFRECEAACRAVKKCRAWTYVVRKKKYPRPIYASCCLKETYPQPIPVGSGVISGIHEPSQAARKGGMKDTLALLPSDQTLEIRVFVDNTFIEVYFQGGRVAITAPVIPTVEAGMSLFAQGASATVEAMTVWRLNNNIWIQPEELLVPRAEAEPKVRPGWTSAEAEAKARPVRYFV